MRPCRLEESRVLETLVSTGTGGRGKGLDKKELHEEALETARKGRVEKEKAW